MNWSTVPDYIPSESVVTDIFTSQLYGGSKRARGAATTLYDPFPAAISRMDLSDTLQHHDGCVNTIEWNANGDTLVTGSDDRRVGIWRFSNATNDGRIKMKLQKSVHSGHSHNIFCAKIVPESNGAAVVSCGADGEVRHFRVDQSDNPAAYIVNHRELEGGFSNGMMYHIDFIRSMPDCIVTCGQTGRLCQYDLRVRTAAPKKLFDTAEHCIGSRGRMGVTAFCFHPLEPHHFLVSGTDMFVRLFDLRFIDEKKECVRKYKPDHLGQSASLRTGASITGLQYSPSGDEFAMNVTGHGIYVVKTCAWQNRMLKNESDTTSYSYDMILGGHRNTQTFLKGVSYAGADGNLLTTGSDCGHIFIYDRHTGHVAQTLKADRHVVNMVSPHPYLPILASCGIDSTGKLFSRNESPTTLLVNRVDVDTLLQENLKDVQRDRESGSYAEYLKSNIRFIRRPKMNPLYGDSEKDPYPSYFSDFDAALQTPEKLLEIGKHLKTLGNEYFKEQQWELAMHKYTKAIGYISRNVNDGSDIAKQNKEVLIASYANASMCLSKMRHFRRTVQFCNEVIALDPTHLKSYFRRAQAYLELGDSDEALKDARKAQELSPGNPEVEDLLRAISVVQQEEQSKERTRSRRIMAQALFGQPPTNTAEGIRSILRENSDEESGQGDDHDDWIVDDLSDGDDDDDDDDDDSEDEEDEDDA